MPRKAAALLIGINEFEDEFYRSLPLLTPPKNINALKEILTDPLLGDVPEQNVICVGNEQGTVNKLMQHLNDFFDADRWKNQGFSGGEDEYLLFYFTGHGALYRQSQDSEFLIITTETSVKRERVERHTALRGIDIAQIIQQCSQELKVNIVVILDCCYGQGFYQHCNNIDNIYFLAASEVLAFDRDDQKEDIPEFSVFSRYLLEGLRKRLSIEALGTFAHQQQKDNHPHLCSWDKLRPVAGQKRIKRIAHGALHLVVPLKIEPANISPEATDLQKTEADYLKWVVTLHRDLKVISADRQGPQTLTIRNKSILVELGGSPDQMDDSLREEKRRHDQEARPDVELEQNVTETLSRAGARSIWSEDAFADGETVTLSNLFEKTNSVVILGDPGSGKTTIARHLAWKQALRHLNKAKENVTRYFPIIISVSDYSEQYQQQNRRLSLSEFLGNPTWKRQNVFDEHGNTLDPLLLRRVLTEKIQARQALLIIDGLDEVDRYREDIIGEIEQFAEQWGFSLDPDKSHQPTSRNIMLVTSRIVGYNARPLQNKGVRLARVKGMNEDKIREFLKNFFFVKFNDGSLSLRACYAKAVANLDELWGQIHPKTPLELATSSLFDISRNPMMLNIIANVYLSGQKLGLERADLYHKFIDSFAGTDRRIRLTTDQLKTLLSEVAFHIHSREPNELIPLARLRQLLLPVFRSGRFPETDIDTFVELFAQEAGLLISKAKDVFGFPHRTIQEYLAACYCVRTEETAVRNLQAYIYSPYWREVVVFMLSELSRVHTPGKFLDIIKQLLLPEMDDNLLLPHHALVISNNLNDLQLERTNRDSGSHDNYELISCLLKPLLTAYTNARLRSYGRSIEEKIEHTVMGIAEFNRPALSEALVAKLTEIKPENQTFWGIADLIRLTGLLDRNLYKQLSQYQNIDNADWDFPINTMFLETTSEEFLIKEYADDKKLEWDDLKERRGAGGDRSIYNQRRRQFLLMLKFRQNRERKTQLRKEVSITRPFFCQKLEDNLCQTPDEKSLLLQSLLQQPHLLRLAAGLYGGYGDWGLKRWTEYYHRLTSFLNLADQQREIQVRNNEQFFIGRFGFDDTTYSCAVYLDTYMQSVHSLQKKAQLPHFQTRFVVRQSPLDRFVIESVIASTGKAELESNLWGKYKKSPDLPERVEILVALLTLSNGSARLFGEIKRENALYIGVISRIKLMIKGLEDAFLRSAPELTEIFSSENYVRKHSEAGLLLKLNLYVESLCRTSRAGIDTSNFQASLSDKLVPIFIADQVFGRLVTRADNPVSYFRSFLESLPDGKNLKRALLSTYWAPNVRAAKHFTTLRWEVPLVPPSALEETLPLEIFDSLEGLLHVFDNLPSDQLISRKSFVEKTFTFLHSLYEENEEEPVGYLLEVGAFQIAFNDAHLGENGKFFYSAGLDQLLSEWRQEVDQLTDPYLRARCLLQRLRSLDHTESPIVCDQIRTGLEAVNDPSKKARVLLKLMEYISEDAVKSDILGEIKSAVALTENTGDRAIFYLRIADFYYEQPDDLKKTLSLCLDACETPEIDPFVFLTAMDSLKVQLGKFSDIFERYQKIVQSVQDPWVKAYLEQRIAAKYVHESETTLDSQTLAPFQLIAAGFEALDQLDRHNHIEGACRRMVVETGTDEAKKAFKEVVEASRSSGITLTVPVAQQIEKWISVSSLEEQTILLPLLNKPSLGAVPYIERWLSSENGLLSAVGLLCMVEQNAKLTTENISALLDLLTSPNQLIRLRAALVFTAGINKINSKGGRKYRTSILGKLLLQKIVEWGFMSDDENTRRTVNVLFLSQILHDSPEQLQNWIDDFNSDKRGKAVIACIVLSNISEVTEDTWKILKKNYVQGDVLLRKCLVNSISSLSWPENNQFFRPIDYWQAIQEAHPGELQERYLFDPWQVIKDFIELAKAKLPVNELNIDKLFADRYVTLDKITEDNFYKIAESKSHYKWSLISPAEADTLRSEYSDHLLALLLAGLRQALTRPDFKNETIALLDLVALFAPRKPVLLQNESYADSHFIGSLLEFTRKKTSWIVTRATLILFRYLPVGGEELFEEIKRGLEISDQDMQKVVEDTLETIDPSLLNGELLFDGLMAELDSPEIKRVQIAAKLLAILVRRKSFKADLTIKIVDKLNSIINHHASLQGLYELTGEGTYISPLRPTFIKRFDEAIYEVLMEVCGD